MSRSRSEDILARWRDGRPVAAPYFCMYRAAWIPCVLSWDEETGEFTRVEGPRGFETWEEAEEAGRFLCLEGAGVSLFSAPTSVLWLLGNGAVAGPLWRAGVAGRRRRSAMGPRRSTPGV